MYEQPSTLVTPSQQSSKRLFIVLIAVLGTGALVFGLLSIYAFNQASSATNTLNAQKQAAAAAAAKEQQATDEANYRKAEESPYRSYVAPLEYGSFEIKFPKTWSSSVIEAKSGDQVKLTVNPDFIRSQNGTDDLRAAKVTLYQRQLTEFIKPYEAQKKLVRKDISVSGIQAVEFTGAFGDKRITRLVAVPVRDKTLVFVNEDAKYADQFQQIIEQSKIIP